MAKTELVTASVLAFERKLDPSDALFSAGKWADIANGDRWPAVGVHGKSVRGTISHRRKANDQDPAKLNAEIESPNLQTVDVATLPNDADTLRIRFTLRVLGGAGIPSACNNAAYLEKLEATVRSYVTHVGFAELSRRYATNLANGRILWRNRVGAEKVTVEIRHLVDGSARKVWQFDALTFSLRHFDAPSAAAQAIAELGAVIELGLTGEAYTLLEVVALARVGDGQEIYPSQELILDKGDKKGQKSKTLYKVGDAAAMHSQKIGNALRTIDTWYPMEDGEELGPIAVEPYGSVTNQGRAYRQPRQKVDFYSLLDTWVLKDTPPKDIGNQHFVMATLIRGGVFGEADKNANGKD